MFDHCQALVSTEPVNSGRVCLKAVISELLVLARPSLPESDTENTAQVIIIIVYLFCIALNPYSSKRFIIRGHSSVT